MAIQNSIDLTATGVIIHDGSGVFTTSTITQYQTLVAGASNTISGVSVGTSGQVLTSNGAGSNPSYQDASAGDVTGPGSSTDNALSRWNGTGGDTLQNSDVIVTDNGEMSNSSQPAFCAYLGTTDSNVTGDTTQFFLGDTSVGTTLTERFDQNSDFNPGASGGAVFTAPVTGNYQLSMYILVEDMNGSGHTPGSNIVTSNQTYFFGYSSSPAAGNLAISAAVLTDMDAADTAKFSVTIAFSTKTVDVAGSATTPKTLACGYLAC